MEFEGTVVSLLPQVKGVSARGEWVKQEVIFEQTGEFGRKVCVSFWGDKAQDAAGLHAGDKVKVAVNVESREYNGRWYTEVRAWKLDKAGAGATGHASAPRGGDYDWGAPAPSQATGSYASAAPSTSPSPAAPADDFDDLPF